METLEGRENIISEIEQEICILRKLQMDCDDEMFWHGYMRKIDRLESQLDVLSRR